MKTQKTAGTSVELALGEICGPEDTLTPLSGEDLSAGTWQPRNFCIPQEYRPRGWQLAVAAGLKEQRAGVRYFQHMNASQVRAAMDASLFDAYKKVTIVRNAWDREVSLYYWATRGQTTPPTFREFVDRWVWRPERKTYEIYSIGGKVVADIVLRYESLAEDFSRFVRGLGIAEPPSLPRAKGAFRSSNARDYRAYFNKQSIEIVRRRQAREIEHFAMTFE